MKFHPLQIKILTALRHSATGLRYRDMRPRDIENDLYNYHLQHLVKQQLLTKDGDYYQLSNFGKEQLIEISPLAAEHATNHKFKLASLCLVLHEQHVLYQIRGHHPFMGHKEIVGGSIKRGEPAILAAKRRLREETGLEADFSLFGLLRKTRYNRDQELYSDILYHICITQDPHGALVSENEFGTNLWIPLQEAIAIEATSSYGSPQFAQILQQLADMEPREIPLFYFEETYTHDIY